MGMCKCKKKIALFCFVHRVFVCENCIVTDHPTCVVKLYSEWLEEPDYDPPTCKLCSNAISLADQPTIRLTCLDAFHVECLNKHMATFPETTALAGYTCPTCTKPIVPASLDNNTHLINTVHNYLSSTPWNPPTQPPVVVVPAASEQTPLLLSETPATTDPSTPAAVQQTQPAPPTVTPTSSVMASRKPQQKQNTPFYQVEEEDKYKKRRVIRLFQSLGFMSCTDPVAETANKPANPMSTQKKLFLGVTLVLALFVLALVVNSRIKAPVE